MSYSSTNNLALDPEHPSSNNTWTSTQGNVFGNFATSSSGIGSTTTHYPPTVTSASHVVDTEEKKPCTTSTSFHSTSNPNSDGQSGQVGVEFSANKHRMHDHGQAAGPSPIPYYDSEEKEDGPTTRLSEVRRDSAAGAFMVHSKRDFGIEAPALKGHAFRPSPALRPTEATPISGYTRKASWPPSSTPGSSGKPQATESFSTVAQSRFFPPAAGGFEPRGTTERVVPQAVSALGTSNTPSSVFFPDGLTGFSNLPKPSAVEGKSVIQHMASEDVISEPISENGYNGGPNEKFDLKALDIALGETDDSTKTYSLRAYDRGQDLMGPPGLPSTPVSRAFHIGGVLYDDGTRSQCGINQASTMTDTGSAAAVSSPSTRYSSGRGPEPNTSAPSLARDFGFSQSSSSEAGSNTSHMRSTNPRGATSIETIERAANTNDSQKTLMTTRPSHSYVTGLSNWRSGNGPASQMGGARTPAFVPGSNNIGPNMQTQTIGRWGSSRGIVGMQDQNDRPPTRRHNKPFKPMNAILYPEATRRPLSDEERASRQENGISDNYQGNPNNPKNQSANIPNYMNCALFLTNLPAQCSYQDLLRAIQCHRPGRIWSTYINRPLSRTDQRDKEQVSSSESDSQAVYHHGGGLMNHQHHPGGGGPNNPIPLSFRTSAAKIIFYHPSEAQNLMAIADRGELKVGGRRITAKWNRHRTGAQNYESATSRVVAIAGPPAIVEEQFLSDLFDQYFEYQTEDVVVVGEGDGWRTIEWRFGSMRAQAHSAYQLLRSLYPEVVTVRWAVDPCAGYLTLSDDKVGRLGANTQGAQRPSAFGRLPPPSYF